MSCNDLGFNCKVVVKEYFIPFFQKQWCAAPGPWPRWSGCRVGAEFRRDIPGLSELGANRGKSIAIRNLYFL